MRLDHSYKNAEVTFRPTTKTVQVDLWPQRLEFSEFRRRYCPRLFKRANPFRKVLWRYIKTRPKHFVALLKEYR